MAELDGVEAFAVVAVVATVVATVVAGVVVAVVVGVAAVVLLVDVGLVAVGAVVATVFASAEVAGSTDADGDAALTDMYPTINIRPEAPAAPASRRARLAG